MSKPIFQGKVRKISSIPGKYKKNITSRQLSLPIEWDMLTLVLLNPDIPVFTNSVDPDQLASEEAN